MAESKVAAAAKAIEAEVEALVSAVTPEVTAAPATAKKPKVNQIVMSDAPIPIETVAPKLSPRTLAEQKRGRESLAR